MKYKIEIVLMDCFVAFLYKRVNWCWKLVEQVDAELEDKPVQDWILKFKIPWRRITFIPLRPYKT